MSEYRCVIFGYFDQYRMLTDKEMSTGMCVCVCVRNTNKIDMNISPYGLHRIMVVIFILQSSQKKTDHYCQYHRIMMVVGDQ